MHPKRLIASAVVVWLLAVLGASHPATVRASTDSNDDRNLDSDLTAVLSAAGFTGDIETTFPIACAGTWAGPSTRNWPISAGCCGSTRCIRCIADNTCGGCHSPTQRVRRLAGDGDRRPEQRLVGPNRDGPAQPAPIAARDQHGALSGVDVERPVQLARRAIRSTTRTGSGFRFRKATTGSRTPRTSLHHRDAPAAGAGAHAADRADRGGRFHRHVSERHAGSDARSRVLPVRRRAGRIVPLPDPATGSRNEPIRQKVAADLLNATPAYRQLFGEVFPDVQAGRADRLLHVRQGDRRVRVHAGLRRRADRPVRARQHRRA